MARRHSVKILVAIAAVVIPIEWAGIALAGSATIERARQTGEDESGRELYDRACASCHGTNGRGATRSLVGFEEALPDFTDCSFATREPDADWMAIIHGGGPARGFATMMPAFGDALTAAEVQEAVHYLRGFCVNDAWPRGELNLPRPFVTEKAYPEDEAVLTTAIATEGTGSVLNELVYERRFGARNQLELVIPFGFLESDGSGDWVGGGLGDIAVGVKRALYFNLAKGSILSVAGEVKFPTGDADLGFGAGTMIVEPFVSFGQILPADAFVHAQAGVEFPTDGDKAEKEVFWRVAPGKSFAQGFGRVWTPMVELQGKRELEAGQGVDWDLIPQLQVTLSTRQHVMMNVGVSLPLNDSANRDTELLIYLLWDWFDGGFFEGW